MKFRIGDKVRVVGYEKIIKEGTLTLGDSEPISTPNIEDSNIYERNNNGCPGFTTEMSRFCGMTATISKINEDLPSYHLSFDTEEEKVARDGAAWMWSDWMLDSVNQKEKEEKVMKELEKKVYVITDADDIVGFIELTESEKNAVVRVLKTLTPDCGVFTTEEALETFGLQ